MKQGRLTFVIISSLFPLIREYSFAVPILVAVVHIFRNFNQYIFTDFKPKNNEEKRRSGATWIGVSQKEPQLGNTKNEKKALRKVAEKRRAYRKFELGTVRSLKATRAILTDRG